MFSKLYIQQNNYIFTLKSDLVLHLIYSTWDFLSFTQNTCPTNYLAARATYTHYIQVGLHVDWTDDYQKQKSGWGGAAVNWRGVIHQDMAVACFTEAADRRSQLLTDDSVYCMCSLMTGLLSSGKYVLDWRREEKYCYCCHLGKQVWDVHCYTRQRKMDWSDGGCRKYTTFLMAGLTKAGDNVMYLDWWQLDIMVFFWGGGGGSEKHFLLYGCDGGIEPAS